MVTSDERRWMSLSTLPSFTNLGIHLLKVYYKTPMSLKSTRGRGAGAGGGEGIGFGHRKRGRFPGP